jgi:hypothetical protein
MELTNSRFAIERPLSGFLPRRLEEPTGQVIFLHHVSARCRKQTPEDLAALVVEAHFLGDQV